MTQFVTYLRVSTQKQGKSKLGLDAQRKMCTDFITANGGTLAHEFVDVESGTHRDRKGLNQAIMYCKKNGYPLVIAKLDRLARDVEFCFKVVNTGIEIHFTDMPVVNTLLLGVFAAVAQYERELTSDRTKKALAVKKAQGYNLGASNEKYRLNYMLKSDKQKEQEISKRAETKRKRFQDSKETQVMFRILRRVFPDATKGEPENWAWGKIGTKGKNKDKIFQSMIDYQEMDETGTLFKRWDFSADERTRQQKLSAYLITLRKSVNVKNVG